jgi:membrane fusion protein (multidrug efflux system)
MQAIKNIFVGFVAFLMIACENTTQVVTPPVPEVTSLLVSSKTVPFNMHFVGEVSSSNLVEIRSKIPGYIISKKFEEGRLVNAGSILFEIDPKPLKADLEDAQSQLAQAEANLENARRTYERIQPLVASRAMSQRDLDNSLASKQTAEARVAGAKARVEAARLNLEYSQIKSPISGMAGRALRKEGSYISGNGSSAEILTTITPVDIMNINFGVSEAEILKFRKGLKGNIITPPTDFQFGLKLILSDGSEYSEVGKTLFRDPVINPATGTVVVTGQISNPDGMLISGQFVRVVMTGAQRPNSILVPQRAVLQRPQGKYVILVDSDEVVSIKEVEAAEWIGEDWLIISGLKVGDRVVVDGAAKLQPGMKVVSKDITSTASTENVKEQQNA